MPRVRGPLREAGERSGNGVRVDRAAFVGRDGAGGPERGGEVFAARLVKVPHGPKAISRPISNRASACVRRSGPT